MNDAKPKYLLALETRQECQPGQWRFVLKATEGSHRLEAEDVEPDVRGERLELLTMVRALEALDQPSRVAVHGGSNYLRQGVWFGISEWPANDWQWECFGKMMPVKNGDLWQRMEHLLNFHSVEFRQRRFDIPHTAIPGNHVKARPASVAKGFHQILPAWGQSALRRHVSLFRRRVGEWLLMFRKRLAYSLLRVG
jgi:ribonuclease HI